MLRQILPVFFTRQSDWEMGPPGLCRLSPESLCEYTCLGLNARKKTAFDLRFRGFQSPAIYTLLSPFVFLVLLMDFYLR